LNQDKKQALTLELLEAIEEREDLTQRHLASRLGVALGLANSYLKRCVKKGYVKIRQAPANRYFYYLAPKGFAEKSRLTGEFLSYSFGFYRRASESCAQVFRQLNEGGHHRVVLFGASDLAEIAVLRAAQYELTVAAVCDPESKPGRFLGAPLCNRIEDCPEFDVCMITDLTDGQSAYRRLSRKLGDGRVVAPEILGLRVRH